MPDANPPAISDGSVLCLLGTSRPNGNTRRLVDSVLQQIGNARLIDVGSLSIAPYDYEHRHEADDFSTIADAMDRAQVIIFATPVYWYSMSAQLKIVFDRLCDLTETRKVIGKRLAGKTVFAVINGEELPDGFLVPFSDTAGYFNMHWGGAFVSLVDQPQSDNGSNAEELSAFARRVTEAAEKGRVRN